jgi:DNA-binding Xre family transcriptional regulator
MLVRVRVPELLEEKGITAYALSRRSEGRISLSTAYRLRDRNGQLDYFESKLLEALCDVLQCEPGELLEREGKRKRGK